MRVLLANPRGFCAGVAMAVEVVDRLTCLGRANLRLPRHRAQPARRQPLW